MTVSLSKMPKYIRQMVSFGDTENQIKSLYWRFQNKPYSINCFMEKNCFQLLIKNPVQFIIIVFSFHQLNFLKETYQNRLPSYINLMQET